MGSKTMKQDSASKRGRLHRIFFVGPKPNVAMDELAERLIALNFIQEVLLEDHRGGYVAKIRFFVDLEPERPETYISRLISRDFGAVVRG